MYDVNLSGKTVLLVRRENPARWAIVESGDKDERELMTEPILEGDTLGPRRLGNSALDAGADRCIWAGEPTKVDGYA